MLRKQLVMVPVSVGALLMVGACSSEQAADSSDLHGVWQMTTLEQSSDGGDSETVPFSGQIIFTEETVAVQAMNPDAEAPDGPYTLGGYEAFYGDLDVDEDAGTFSIEVESAVARDLIGQNLSRNYEVEDDTLVLTPTDASEGWRVTYERRDD